MFLLLLFMAVILVSFLESLRYNSDYFKAAFIAHSLVNSLYALLFAFIAYIVKYFL